MSQRLLVMACIACSLAGCDQGGDSDADGDSDAEGDSDADGDSDGDSDADGDGTADGGGDADEDVYVEGEGHCVRPADDCAVSGDGSGWECAASEGGSGAFAGLPSELTRGEVYFVADGVYDGYAFDDPEAGSALVTIRKATAAAHGPATGWSGELGDGVADWGALHFATSYYVFDGVTGGGARSFTAGHGFRLEGADAGSSLITTAEVISHIAIRHTELTHRGDTLVVPSGDAFSNVDTMEDFEFSSNYVHHLSGLPLFMRGGARWLIEQNYMDDVCGCSLHDADWHCEHLVVHGADDLTVRYNVLLGGRSTGILVNNDLESRGWKVYGNVFDNDEGSAVFSVAADPADHSSGFVVVNNVFMGDSTAKLIMDNDDHLIFNNIFFDTAQVTSLPSVHDYNYYAEVGALLCDMGFAPHENGIARYPTDCDALEEAGDPFVDAAHGDFRLAAALVGWPGVDLCDGLLACTSTDTYDLDMLGVRRGADGVWDRGALELAE